MLLRSLSGVLLFSLGGAVLVVALGFAMGDAVHGMIGGGFAWGAWLGFLAFFFIGIGLTLILEAKDSA